MTLPTDTIPNPAPIQKGVVILNPASGKRKPERLAKRIQLWIQKLELPLDLWMWNPPEMLPRLVAQARDSGYDTVIAAGGDGSVQQIASLLVNSPIQLGILPVGTGNGIAHALNIPRDLVQAMRLLQAPNPRMLDTGVINDQFFLGFCSFGVDAAVAHIIDQKAGKKSFWGYFMTVLRLYPDYPPDRSRIILDGTHLPEAESIIMALMNTGAYGHGVRVARDADPEDGKLTLVRIAPLRVWQVINLIFRVFFGQVETASYYTSWSGSHIILERSHASPVQLDGEAYDMEPRLEVKIRSSSLTVLTGLVPEKIR